MFSQQNIPIGWIRFLSEDIVKKVNSIEKTIDMLTLNGEIVYPVKAQRYKALRVEPLAVKVIILGQDPYHGEGEAMGLSFSVPTNKTIPSSLRNMFNELHSDIGCIIPKSGDLQPWTDQGVLLLNRYLSVEKNLPNSHHHLGWHLVTNEIIHKLVMLHKEKLVIVLLGNQAAKIEREVNLMTSHVIKTSHPSSMCGAYKKGFQGSKIFSRINQHLLNVGLETIDWSLCPHSIDQKTPID